MTEGLNGFNVRTLGVNRDGILTINTRTNAGVTRDMTHAALEIIGGKFALVQDDPVLVAELENLGVQTVFRQSGDEHGLLDARDDRELRAKAEAFTQERLDKGATFTHLSNEVVSSPRLQQWTRYCLEYAANKHRKVVPFNYGTHAPRWQWEQSEANVRYAIEHDMPIGVHLYPDGIHDDTLFEFAWLKKKYGGDWFVTEYAYIRHYQDADRGHRGVMDDDQYAAWLERNTQRVIDALGIDGLALFVFSFEPWRPNPQGIAQGFGIHDRPKTIAKLGALNKRFKYVKGKVMTWQTHDFGTRKDNARARVTQTINVRAEPSTSAAIVGALLDGTVLSFWDKPWQGNGYKWYKVLFGGAERYVAEVSGLRFEAPAPVPDGVTLTAAQWQKVQEAASILVALAQEVKPEQSGGF